MKASSNKHDKLKPPKSEGTKKPFSPEAQQKVLLKVRELAEPLCDSEGIELVFVEYQRESQGRILRLYIDKPGGITLDDCVEVSRQLGDLLDVSLESEGPYSLEVTSPGSDRPLGKPSDFERFKGNLAKIRLKAPLEGQKNFKGILLGLSENNKVLISVNNQTVTIPLKEISKARLVNYNGEN